MFLQCTLPSHPIPAHPHPFPHINIFLSHNSHHFPKNIFPDPISSIPKISLEIIGDLRKSQNSQKYFHLPNPPFPPFPHPHLLVMSHHLQHHVRPSWRHRPHCLQRRLSRRRRRGGAEGATGGHRAAVEQWLHGDDVPGTGESLVHNGEIPHVPKLFQVFDVFSLFFPKFFYVFPWFSILILVE